MFFFDNNREVKRRIRSEWGEVEDITLYGLAPRLTDEELAELLGCNQAVVETHRRD